jgi:hypothetical protein
LPLQAQQAADSVSMKHLVAIPRLPVSSIRNAFDLQASLSVATSELGSPGVFAASIAKV